MIDNVDEIVMQYLEVQSVIERCKKYNVAVEVNDGKYLTFVYDGKEVE